MDSLPAGPLGKPKNTGVGSISGIFLTQELNQGLLCCRRILYQLSYQGSPPYSVSHIYNSTSYICNSLWVKPPLLPFQLSSSYHNCDLLTSSGDIPPYLCDLGPPSLIIMSPALCHSPRSALVYRGEPPMHFWVSLLHITPAYSWCLSEGCVPRPASEHHPLLGLLCTNFSMY